MQNFQIALDNLEVAEELVDKTDSISYIKILNNKANCLYRRKLYKEALKVFNNISEFINKSDLEKYLINLINIVDVYMDIDDKEKAVEKLNVIISELPNLSNDSAYLPEIYFEIGKSYKQLNKAELSEKYYLEALDFCEKCKNYVLANDVLCGLIELYTIKKNVNKMNKTKEKVFSIANKQDKVSNILMYKLINFYNEVSNSIVSEITDYALKFSWVEGYYAKEGL